VATNSVAAKEKHNTSCQNDLRRRTIRNRSVLDPRSLGCRGWSAILAPGAWRSIRALLVWNQEAREERPLISGNPVAAWMTWAADRDVDEKTRRRDRQQRNDAVSNRYELKGGASVAALLWDEDEAVGAQD
jgi:hypothetical protein